MEQDPVTREDKPDGTRLLSHYRGQRVCLFIPRVKEPTDEEIAAGKIWHTPRVELIAACECGRPECWMPAPLEMRASFIRTVAKEMARDGDLAGQTLHEGLVERMRAVLRVFSQGGQAN